MGIKQLGRNDLCCCGSGSKYKKCHEEFDKKIMEFAEQGHIVPNKEIIKNSEEIDAIRISGKVNIAVLDYVSENIKQGMTTNDIDLLVYQKTTDLGGIPAPLGFEGYPKSVCTSINNQVCHGIPSKDVILKDGDIINVDVSTIYDGYYSDSSRMYCIGNVIPENKRLVNVVKECVDIGLSHVKPWGFLGDVGHAVHEHALKNGYSVVEEIGGHGIGLDFHEEPWVSFVSEKGTEMLMVPGMIFTIEPMVNLGSRDIFVDKKNGWTLYTKDGKPSAQWEIMVLVTETGSEVLAY